MTNWMESVSHASAWLHLALFLAASVLMTWRLECMTARGMEGTALGALVMPYCSGMGNLVFVFVLAVNGGPGREAVVNALVNNVTNVTLLLGLPAVLWGLVVVPRGRGSRRKQVQAKLHRLSLLLTMSSLLFFSWVVWALARDGVLDSADGLVLIALFLFWQCFEFFDVLKHNARKNRQLSPWLILDVALLAVGTVGLYISVNGLTSRISALQSGFISARYLGWLTGWLMVLPNAMLALYYGWKRRAEVVYSSQIADGHICIPLCLGIFACVHPIEVPSFLSLGLGVIAAGAVVHLACLVLLGRLPRLVGWVFLALYAVFVVKGLGAT